jgi:hypothetical protein
MRASGKNLRGHYDTAALVAVVRVSARGLAVRGDS